MALHPSKTSLFPIGLALAIALFWILGGLSSVNEPWNGDEMYGYSLAKLPIAEMVQTTKRDDHPPLFYLILHAWVTVFPDRNGTKILTLLMGAVVVAMSGIVGRKLYGARGGIAAALLLASFPHFIYFGTFLRMYVFALFFELLAVWGWLASRDRPKSAWIAFTVGLLGGLYCQNLVLFFNFALVLFILIAERRDSRFLKRWLFPALATAAILYAPWMHVPFGQSSRGAFLEVFQAPTLRQIARSLFLHTYFLGESRERLAWLSWVPGVVVLGILPAIAIFRYGKAGPRGLLPVWLSAFPLTLLLTLSILWKPVIVPQRHAILFVPFLILAAGGLFSNESHRWLRTGFFAAFIATCMIAHGRGVRSHNLDFRPCKDALIERAPLNLPIVIYADGATGMIGRSGIELWSPIPIMDYRGNLKAFPRDLRECVFVVTTSQLDPNREQTLGRATELIERCSGAKPIHISYDFQAYILSGIPTGALRDLFLEGSKKKERSPARALGNWNPDINWSANLLAQFCAPPPETEFGSSGVRGARLIGADNRIEVPIKKATDNFQVVALGCAIRSTQPELKFEFKVGGDQSRARWTAAAMNREFEWVAWVAGDETSAIFEVALPSPFYGARTMAQGDAPEGLYVNWGAAGIPEDTLFKREGREDWFINIGSLSDGFFIRSGFHQREGSLGADYRWAKREFLVECPVREGGKYDRFVLFGDLAAAIRDRTCALEISVSPRSDEVPTQTVRSQATPGEGYSEWEFPLPEKLSRGIARVRVTFSGEWRPIETGEGADPRRLAFRLDGIGLR